MADAQPEKNRLLRKYDDAIQNAKEVENSIAETTGELGRIKNVVREDIDRMERDR
ncbi:MAG: hypothetical protein OEY99_02140 [Aigarchaeota archaeon]|nr:hypothetical protein [Aigarchaeota archaeon]MDH5702989.1 hypothetical protein [Aigarchaeota archaeon]